MAMFVFLYQIVFRSNSWIDLKMYESSEQDNSSLTGQNQMIKDMIFSLVPSQWHTQFSIRFVQSSMSNPRTRGTFYFDSVILLQMTTNKNNVLQNQRILSEYWFTCSRNLIWFRGRIKLNFTYLIVWFSSMISYPALEIRTFSNQPINYSGTRFDREKRTSPSNSAWKILLEWTIPVRVICRKNKSVGLRSHSLTKDTTFDESKSYLLFSNEIFPLSPALYQLFRATRRMCRNDNLENYFSHF